MSIVQLHWKQIQDLREHFHSKQDNHMYEILCTADANLTPLKLKNQELETTSQSMEEKLLSWKQKSLHGSYPHQLEDTNVDSISSHIWLTSGNLYGETTGFMMAIQDRVISTRNYRKYILKETLDDKCRLCTTETETIEHITGACKILAGTEYLRRHNNFAKIVHSALAVKEHLNVESVPYYQYQPPPVLENESAKMYWDREIRTDKTITANRPDITVLHKIRKEVTIIDITVPLAHNLHSAYSNKISKYRELAEEIKKIWKVEKVHIRPLTISTTGIVTKSLIKQLQELNIKHVLAAIQKAIILDTCRIVSKTITDMSDM